MAFEVEFTPEAETDLDGIRPFYRIQILNAIEAHLQYAPTQVSRSRIKRLREIVSPAFRLRVEDFRVFYDVNEQQRSVTVLRVLDKEQSLQYLKEVSDDNYRTGKLE
jgi:mRNA-degrading endonuclease RelE of RelBE toxin-antitoxin system